MRFYNFHCPWYSCCRHISNSYFTCSGTPCFRPQTGPPSFTPKKPGSMTPQQIRRIINNCRGWTYIWQKDNPIPLNWLITTGANDMVGVADITGNAGFSISVDDIDSVYCYVETATPNITPEKPASPEPFTLSAAKLSGCPKGWAYIWFTNGVEGWYRVSGGNITVVNTPVPNATISNVYCWGT